MLAKYPPAVELCPSPTAALSVLHVAVLRSRYLASDTLTDAINTAEAPRRFRRLGQCRRRYAPRWSRRRRREQATGDLHVPHAGEFAEDVLSRH